MLEMDSCLVKRPLLHGDPACGDTGVVVEIGGEYFLALVDALGHGPEAHETAVAAEQYLSEHCADDLLSILNGLHERLRGSRGAVAALCRLNPDTGELRYAGMGNITARLLGPRASRLVPRDGIVGYQMPTPREETLKFYKGDVLVLCSDGIQEHFDPSECPGLLTGTARSIATELLTRFGKDNDDASCLVVRYRNDKSW
jgi:negative regulator of sigma-B (phosphoserine phosphatase)